MGKIAGLLRSRGIWPLGMVFNSSGNAGDVYVRQSTRSARFSPFGKMVLEGGGTAFGEHRINRYVSDSDRNYFGYDLLFDSAGNGVYRISFEPLSVEPNQFLPAPLRLRSLLPLEQLPPPQVLGLGDALEFSLATTDGKYKVVERIEFSKPFER